MVVSVSLLLIAREFVSGSDGLAWRGRSGYAEAGVSGMRCSVFMIMEYGGVVVFIFIYLFLSSYSST